jgi:hypothetical protein
MQFSPLGVVRDALLRNFRKEITSPNVATSQKTWFLNSNAVVMPNLCVITVKNIFISAYFMLIIHLVLLVHDSFSMKQLNAKSLHNIWTQSS